MKLIAMIILGDIMGFLIKIIKQKSILEVKQESSVLQNLDQSRNILVYH